MNLAAILKKKIDAESYRRLKKVSEVAHSHCLEPWLIGGVVRDLIMSVPVKKDLDITVAGGNIAPLAESLSDHWKAKLYSYPQFMTFTLEFPDGNHIDLITARDEIYPHPAALPVVKMGTLESDLRRRDFTINAIALSLTEDRWGEALDPFNGMSDIKRKLIRILHDKSFEDDPTRIFRAARFVGRLKFKLEQKTEALIHRSIENQEIKRLSSDRIRTEIEKILIEENPERSIQLLQDWKVLEQIDLSWSAESTLLFKKLPRSKNPDTTIAVRMVLWLNGRSHAEAEQIVTALNFSGDLKEKILQPLGILELLKSDRTIETLPQIELFQETTIFFNQLTRQKIWAKIKKRWLEYQKWVRCKPSIDGEALKKLGFVPGPLFKKIFEELSVRKYKGELKNRAAEIRFVIDNFRRD